MAAIPLQQSISVSVTPSANQTTLLHVSVLATVELHADTPVCHPCMLLQDGGCCVSAPVGQASSLTHLLLVLQNKQLLKQQRGTLLLLQPVSCNPQQMAAAAPSTPVAAAAAAAAELSLQGPSGGRRSSSSSGRSTVLRPGASSQEWVVSCECDADEVKLFATFIPVSTVLSLEAATATAATSAAAAAAKDGSRASAEPAGMSVCIQSEAERKGSVSVEPSSHATLRSWSAAESSSEEPAGSSSSSRHSSSSQHSSRHASELLRAASNSSSSSGAAALLADAAGRGRLRSIKVGPHADPAATAASIMTAVVAGEVLSLQVKGQAAAHTVAYAALQYASRELHSSSQAVGLGVLLVQGQGHEHVHAKSQGHSSAGSLDGQQAAGTAAAGAAAAAADATQALHQHQQHAARVITDATMNVGGFGAAFYGLGAWAGGPSSHPAQPMQHQHGQEVWLCVVPLRVAA